MTRNPAWLREHRRDVHSQTGEDGVIERALDVLPERDGWCVEVGAWDGLLYSNSRHLIESRGYAAVLIERDRARFASLSRNCLDYPKVIPVHAHVGLAAGDGLDAILARHPVVPRELDFLSIDIDGNDYHVWRAMVQYRPKLVCIEFNQTLATEARFVQPPDPAVTLGASLRSLVELGRSKGYELVSVLKFNAFFVAARFFPLFDIADNSPGSLRPESDDVTYLFSGLDGSIHLTGGRRLPWHGIGLDEARMQRLPRFIRKYPGDYTAIEKAAYYGYLALVEPALFLRRVIGAVRSLRRR